MKYCSPTGKLIDSALKKAERNAPPPFQRTGNGVARSISRRRTTRSDMGTPWASGAIAQLAPQDLADIALGQAVEEFDPLRALVGGQVFAAMGAQRGLIEQGRLAHHVQPYRLAAVLAGRANGGRLG